MRRTPGFTLLEVMFVLAIVSVLAALSFASVEQLGARNATQNAASELGAVLQLARARAEQRGNSVYVLVFPRLARNGSMTAGRGAVFVYEDAGNDFLTSSGACDGASSGAPCGWAGFTPPASIAPRPNTGDRLVRALYLEDFPKQNVRFGKPAAVSFAAPFGNVGVAADATGCSFCSGSAPRGALVFTGDALRFLDDTGGDVPARVAGLALQGVKDPGNVFLYGLVGATGLVTLVR